MAKYKKPDISISKLALTHACPACGRGSIYEGLLSVRQSCEYCGVSLRSHDAGDGPAFFAMCVASVLVIGLAIIIDLFLVKIPLWAIVLVWAPITIALSVYFLRMIKAVLIALEYQHHLLSGGIESKKKGRK